MLNYKHHVFLSYDHRDSDVMQNIRSYLEANGLHVWADKKIKSGSVWNKEIKNALDDCGCMVVIFTSYANESKWVSREIEYADSNEILFIPFVVSGEPQKSLIVNSTQYIDARDFDGAASKLVSDIRDYLKLSPIIQPDAEYQIAIPGEDIYPTDTLKKYHELGETTKQVLWYMNEHKAEYDRSPTIRDIVNNLPMSSTSVVDYHVKRLRTAGFLEQNEKLARGTFIVKPFPKYDVFLSYSLANQEIAYQIEKSLASKDLRVCITERIGPAFTRLARIQDEIRNSVCMLTILSPYAKHSIKVLSHLICAQETQTPIIPLLVSGNPIDSIPTTLPTRYYDMRDVSDTRLDEFGDLLMRYVGRLI